MAKDLDYSFITTMKPYNIASKDSFSKRIRPFLVECGVGREFATFSPHSLRHTATSSPLAKH